MNDSPHQDVRDPDRDDSRRPLAPPSTPLQRLQMSRERMRQYLLPAVRKPRDADAGFADKISGKLGEWRDHPLVGAVIDAVQGWWANHPLRSVADIGSTAARELAEPLVRRHPAACVVGALVIGALAVRIRPWRWILRPALFAGLTTQVVSRLLSDAPMEFVLNALMKLKRHPPPDTPDVPAPTASVASQGPEPASPATHVPVAANDPANDPVNDPASDAVDAPAAGSTASLHDLPPGSAAQPVPEVAAR